jgi:hypothetical protein
MLIRYLQRCMLAITCKKYIYLLCNVFTTHAVSFASAMLLKACCEHLTRALSILSLVCAYMNALLK